MAFIVHCRGDPYDERLSPRFCDPGDTVAGAVFQENHQGQGSDEGADEEVQRHGVAIGIFFDKRQDQGTGDAGSPPGRKDTAVMALRYFVPKRSLR